MLSELDAERSVLSGTNGHDSINPGLPQLRTEAQMWWRLLCVQERDRKGKWGLTVRLLSFNPEKGLVPFVRVHTSVFCFQCGLDKAPGFSSVKREGTFFVILVYLDVAYFRCTHTHTHTRPNPVCSWCVPGRCGTPMWCRQRRKTCRTKAMVITWGEERGYRGTEAFLLLWKPVKSAAELSNPSFPWKAWGIFFSKQRISSAQSSGDGLTPWLPKNDCTSWQTSCLLAEDHLVNGSHPYL